MKKVILITTFSLLVFVGIAQTSSLPDPKPYFTAIIVENIDASIDWYGKTLGYEVINQNDMSDRGFRQANLQRGNALLELIELSSAASPAELLKDQPPRTRIQGLFKIGFTVSSFDEWIKFLTDEEVEFNGSVVNDPNSGKQMIIILDPDGNRIQLFEE